jgi:hypothetical protein
MLTVLRLKNTAGELTMRKDGNQAGKCTMQVSKWTVNE